MWWKWRKMKKRQSDESRWPLSSDKDFPRNVRETSRCMEFDTEQSFLRVPSCSIESHSKTRNINSFQDTIPLMKKKDFVFS
jgi:hypothetical protein